MSFVPISSIVSNICVCAYDDLDGQQVAPFIFMRMSIKPVTIRLELSHFFTSLSFCLVQILFSTGKKYRCLLCSPFHSSVSDTLAEEEGHATSSPGFTVWLYDNCSTKKK